MESGKKKKCLRTLGTAIVELETLLEEENPFIFSWDWIVKRNRPLSRYFRENIFTKEEFKHCNVSMFLPEKWQKIYKDTIFCNIIIDLFNFLEEKNPESFSRVWLIRNAGTLYWRICKHIRKDDEPDWLSVISALPKKWQARWDDGGFNFQKLINDLVNFFEETQPLYINKSLIRDNANALYKRIARNVRKENDGKIDWPRIVIAWPEEWQKKWVWERCSEEKLPQKWKMTQGSYSCQDEVQIILSENKEYLYTLVSASSKEEKKIRDEIMNSLIRLAQNGNIEARKKLTPYLELKCADWGSAREGFHSSEMAYDEIMKKIDTCINNFDFSIGFLKYLHSSIRRQLIGEGLLSCHHLDFKSEGGKSLYGRIDADVWDSFI